MYLNISNRHNSKFVSVFLDYYPKVCAFVSSIVMDREAAEDIAEDIFVRILESSIDLSVARNIESYLYIVSRNAALDYLKKNSMLSHDLNERVTSYGNSSSEETIIEQELLKYVNLIIEGMPEQRRKVFVMSKVEDMSNDEISESLGITKRTVESHLYQAIREIRSKVKILVVVMVIY